MPTYGLAQTPEKSGMATAFCVLLLVGPADCAQAGIAIAAEANTTNKRKSGRCNFMVSSIVVRLCSFSTSNFSAAPNKSTLKSGLTETAVSLSPQVPVHRAFSAQTVKARSHAVYDNTGLSFLEIPFISGMAAWVKFAPSLPPNLCPVLGKAATHFAKPDMTPGHV
jgi:hypothetical protein